VGNKSPWRQSSDQSSVVPNLTEKREISKNKQALLSNPSPFKKKSQRERRREAGQSKSDKEQQSPLSPQKEEKKENTCPW